MKGIIILRHGQCHDNVARLFNGRSNSKLTQEGVQQVINAAQRLKQYNIVRIYSSPLMRAYQTAMIIAGQLNMNSVIFNFHLIERDFGVLEGKSVEDVPKYCTKFVAHPDERVSILEAPNAETLSHMYERARLMMEGVVETSENEKILFVTHGYLALAMYGFHHMLPEEEVFTSPVIKNGEFFEL